MYSNIGDFVIKVFSYLSTGIRGLVDSIMTAIGLGTMSDIILVILSIIISMFLVGWIMNSKTIKWLSRGVVAVLIFLLLRGLKL